MNKDRILIPVAVITVSLLHAGLIALLWETYKPLIPEMANIEFVDLADLGGGDGGGDGTPEGEGAPAAPEKTPEPQKFARTKTDKQDAKLIAEYCQTAKAQDLVIRKPIIDDGYKLKRLSALYAQLTADSTAQKNRLEAAKDTFVVKICQSNIRHLQKQIKAVKKELEKLTKQPALKDQTDRLATT